MAGFDDIRHKVMKVLANAAGLPEGATAVSGFTAADVTSTTPVTVIANAAIPAGKSLWIQKIFFTNHTAAETPLITVQSITGNTAVAGASLNGIANAEIDFGVIGIQVPDAAEGVEALADSATGDCRVAVLGYYK